jgi:hypothetical protein
MSSADDRTSTVQFMRRLATLPVITHPTMTPCPLNFRAENWQPFWHSEVPYPVRFYTLYFSPECLALTSFSRCLAHIINLAAQALISTRVAEDDLSGVTARERD